MPYGDAPYRTGGRYRQITGQNQRAAYDRRMFLARVVLVILVASMRPVGAAEWKLLFDGKTLEGWDTFLAGGIGLNKDPKKVFGMSEVDGRGAIHVSGEIYGAVTTHEEFDNFHLKLQF